MHHHNHHNCVWEKLRDDDTAKTPSSSSPASSSSSSTATSVCDAAAAADPSSAVIDSPKYDDDHYYMEKLRELQLMSRESLNLSMDEVDEKLASREMQIRSEFAAFQQQQQQQQERQQPQAQSRVGLTHVRSFSSPDHQITSASSSASHHHTQRKTKEKSSSAKTLLGLFKRSKQQQQQQQLSTSASGSGSPSSGGRSAGDSLFKRFSVSLNLHKSSDGTGIANTHRSIRDLSAPSLSSSSSSPSSEHGGGQTDRSSGSSNDRRSSGRGSGSGSGSASRPISSLLRNSLKLVISPASSPPKRVSMNSNSSISSHMSESAQTEFDMWMAQFDAANNSQHPHELNDYNRPLGHEELSAFVAKFCLLAPEHDKQSIDLLHEEGMVYMKKTKGHFKEYFVELSNSEILFWLSKQERDDGQDPRGRYPLDISFNLHRIGTTSAMVKQSSTSGAKRKSGTGPTQPQMVRGHVFALVPSDRERQELVLCIPDDDVYERWMQCLDLYEIISFSTLQFSTSLSHRELLEHSIVDEFALFREQSQVRGDAGFNRMMMQDYKNKIRQLMVCPF